MRSNPDQDGRLRARLQEAVDHFSAGSADEFGRRLGYTNGGYIREILRGVKPLRSAVVDRMEAVKGMGGWFDSVVTPVTARDIAGSRKQPAAGPELAERLAAVLRALDDDALDRARKALSTLADSPDSDRATQALARALSASPQAIFQVSPSQNTA